MSIFHSIILGIVEGITEFLPISSTFHLIYTSKLLGIFQTEFQKFFEVFIQGGAILAVAILFFKEVINDIDLIKKTVVAFIPTAFIGFILYRVIKNIFFEAQLLMFTMLIIVGLIFILTEWLVKKDRIKLKKSLKNFSYKEAFLIGLVQALAVIPGVSRAGSVILGMMFLGYKRDEAAKFSFILSVPTILAASGYDLFKMRSLIVHNMNNLGILMIGFIVSFFFALIAVKWLISYLQKNSLFVFGVYRILLAIILLQILR